MNDDLIEVIRNVMSESLVSAIKEAEKFDDLDEVIMYYIDNAYYIAGLRTDQLIDEQKRKLADEIIGTFKRFKFLNIAEVPMILDMGLRGLLTANDKYIGLNGKSVGFWISSYAASLRSTAIMQHRKFSEQQQANRDFEESQRKEKEYVAETTKKINDLIDANTEKDWKKLPGDYVNNSVLYSFLVRAGHIKTSQKDFDDIQRKYFSSISKDPAYKGKESYISIDAKWMAMDELFRKFIVSREKTI